MIISRTSQVSLLLVILSLTGCVHTRISTFNDPAPAPGPYHRIAVDYLDGSLFNKKKVEQIVATALEDRTNQLEVVLSCDILPPTRSHTDQEIADLLQEKGCDGYLSLQVIDRVIKEQLPFGLSVTRPAEQRDLNKSILGEGSETLSQEIEIKLINLADKRCVWIASSMTDSYGMNKFKTAIRSMARKVASQLITSGLVR